MGMMMKRISFVIMLTDMEAILIDTGDGVSLSASLRKSTTCE